MIKDLLQHGWKSQVRSSFWQRSLAVNILLGLFVVYLMLNFLALGFFLDVILAEAFPDEDPFTLFNGFLLYTILAGLAFRFFMQNFPVLDIQNYLLLPIPKRHLFHYLLIKSVFNVVNLMPLLFIVPFAGKVVFPQEGSTSGWVWVALLLAIVLFNNFLAFYLKRQFTAHPLAVIGSLAGLAGLILLDVKEVLPLSGYFASAVGYVIAHPVGLVLGALLVLGAYFLTYGFLRRYTYLDALEGQGQTARSTQGFAALERFGKVGAYLQLELKQIWRNKRPKTMLALSIVILFYPFLAIDDFNQGEGMGMLLFMFVLAIVFPMATYGQFLISWDSHYFSLILARRVSFREYLEGKYYLFILLTTLTTTLCLLYGFSNRDALPIVLAAGLFNLGVTVYFVLFMATYNTRPVDPTKSAMMNWEGIGASQFVLLLPVFLLPWGLYAVSSTLVGSFGALAILGGVGLVGIALRGWMLSLIRRQFEKRKYILASSFKQK
ncbi:MAG: hypothetical protein KDD19_05180 [Phaeodactylibacter sp.]|nr:hypothetical protein [Phaeodactylibacter sp.]MCB9053018.1 hypothetical protein [Lewinellaceae bacterium]